MELFAGRYQLTDPIGEGGMGSVWRAWDAKRGEYVAAKLLRPSDAGSLLRFVREQALRVSHPHVVAPNGWAAEDDKVLLTMDLVGGGSVANLIGDHGAIPLPYTAVLIDQLLSALIEVHAHGIVHRDLKPSNLLLEPTGRAAPALRLSDFGIAAVTGEPRLTETEMVVGTPGYLAPEALAGDEPAGGHDVYGAFMVAWQLLTGETPPRNGTPPVSDAPEGIGPPVWETVMAFISTDPTLRHAGAVYARQRWRWALGQVAVPGIDVVDPDAIEVFDHLGELPDGFGPAGPLPATPVNTAAMMSALPPGIAAVPPTVSADSPTVRLTPPQAPVAPPPVSPPSVASPVTVAPTAAPPRRGRAGLLIALVVTGLGALVLVASVGLLLR